MLRLRVMRWKVVPLAAALQRIVFAQRKGGEFLGHQNAPQVGMAVEHDAEHVAHFALQPVGPFPQRHDRRHGQVRLVEEHAHGQPLVRARVGQQIDQAKAIGRVAIVQVIDARDVDQQIEAALVLQATAARRTA